MNQNKTATLLIGTGIFVVFLVSFWFSKLPLDLFFSTIGLTGMVIGFYIKDKKINISIGFIAAIFGVNIIQWLILIYTSYNYPDNTKTVLSYYIVTIPVLIIIFYKNAQLPKESILIDKTKSILFLTGIFVIISCLASFIIYYSPIFLWGVTLGAMAIIYGVYHENKKVNVSVNYAKAMISLIILQFFILIYFGYQIYKFDPELLSISFILSLNITSLFAIQFYRSDLKINDLKFSDSRILDVILYGKY